MAFNLLSLIPTAISLFSGSNKQSAAPGGAGVPTNPMPDWQYDAGASLSSWAQKFLSMYNPGEAYGGQLTAKTPTSFEQMGLGELGTLLGQPPTGDLFNAAKGQVMDTLGGKYADPNTSPFIQSWTKLAGQNLRDSINTERGQRGARGTYFTRAGVDAESRLTERTQNTLNALIGDFMNTERGRQLTAADMAKGLEGYATDASLKRVTASQTLGALPRLLEQADLESKYNAWLNQRTELQGVPGVARSVFGTNVPPPVGGVQQPASFGSSQQSVQQNVAPWISLAMKLIPQLQAA